MFRVRVHRGTCFSIHPDAAPSTPSKSLFSSLLTTFRFSLSLSLSLAFRSPSLLVARFQPSSLHPSTGFSPPPFRAFEPTIPIAIVAFPLRDNTRDSTSLSRGYCRAIVPMLPPEFLAAKNFRYFASRRDHCREWKGAENTARASLPLWESWKRVAREPWRVLFPFAIEPRAYPVRINAKLAFHGEDRGGTSNVERRTSSDRTTPRLLPAFVSFFPRNVGHAVLAPIPLRDLIARGLMPLRVTCPVTSHRISIIALE